jgi:hypothetical protein
LKLCGSSFLYIFANMRLNMRSIFLLFSGLFTGLAFGQQVEVGLMLGASNPTVIPSPRKVLLST